MDDNKRSEAQVGKPPADPTTELYRRVVERADKPKRGRGRKGRPPRSDGEVIAEIGDEVGGPA